MNNGLTRWLIVFMCLLTVVNLERLRADTCKVSVETSDRVVDCTTGLPLPGQVKVSMTPGWFNHYCWIEPWFCPCYVVTDPQGPFHLFCDHELPCIWPELVWYCVLFEHPLYYPKQICGYLTPPSAGIIVLDLGTVCLERKADCGDVDRTGDINIADVVYLVIYIFAGGPAPNPVKLGDTDCSGNINIADVVYLISYIFRDGSAPCAACP